MNVRTATFCLRTGLTCIQSPTLFFQEVFFLFLIVCGVGGNHPENNHTLPSDSGSVYICQDGSSQELINRAP